MRITPWMLTMTTFVMVGAIAVMYLFKPPQRLPTGTLPPGTNFVNARVFAKPLTRSPEDGELSTDEELVPDAAPATIGDQDEQPYTPQSPIGDRVVELAPNETEMPPPVEPIDPMFEGQAEPVEPGFVTQQFRGGRRIDVTFREGEQFEVPRVSSAFGIKRTN